MKKEHNHPPLTETISKEHNPSGKSEMFSEDIPIVTKAKCKEKRHQAESEIFGEDIHENSLEVMAKELHVEKSKDVVLDYLSTLMFTNTKTLLLVYS